MSSLLAFFSQHKKKQALIKINSPKSLGACLLPLQAFSMLIGLMAMMPASAGYYRFPLEGFHKACADGSSVDIAIFSGYGAMYLSGSGNPMNAFPLETMSGGWSPVLGGSSLCWTRPMSQESQYSFVRSWQTYCVRQSKSYCVYE